MNAFAYRDGHYYAENVAIRQIADAVGTPFYCNSRAAIEARYDAFANPLRDFNALICCALKANSNQALIALLAAGIPASRIVYSVLRSPIAKMMSERLTI